MKFLLCFVLILPITASAGDVLVYTCYQNFNSRVYIMDMNGSVLDWFQYDNYRLCDLELVDGEVHLVDAFAPRSFILDLESGDLELIIDDWSLFYFYDIAFDGNYLYVTEWDMNRYLPDGTKDSSTPYEGSVLGSTYVDDRLYTLSEDTLILAWDLSLWPDMIPDPFKAIIPPSPFCRSLSHDGEYFWTAESIEDQLGSIYCFDASGVVITQIPEPAYRGWGVCFSPNYYLAIQSNTWASIKSSF